MGPNYVVCVHSKPVKQLGRVREKPKAGFVSSSASRMAQTVLDAVVDEYLPIMDAPSARADEVEAKLLGGEEDDSTPSSSASSTRSPRSGGSRCYRGTAA